MNELRLVPGAAAMWVVVVVVTHTRSLLWGLAAACLLAALAAWWQREQGIVVGALSAAAALVCSVKARAADTFDFSRPVLAQVSSVPQRGKRGWFFRANVEGFPAELPVISRDPPPVAQFDTVLLSGKAAPSDGLGRALFIAESIEVRAHASGWQHWAAGIKQHFQHVVIQHASGESQGLIPAMVLGDASLQTPEARERYAITGLAHLSAVSGGNVAMVTTAVVAVCMLAGVGRRLALLAALGSLGMFVLLVGLEPSVVRASIMGSVSLAAMLANTRAPPMHALAIAVTLLLLVDPSMGTSLGFCLSVLATAGIIACFPLIYRGIANSHIPDVLSRMAAVTIAAELATLPVVVAMSGRISLVSVAANLLVAPVVPVITVLGLVAVMLSGTVLGGLLVALVNPLAGWIAAVARRLAALPLSHVTVPADTLTLAWVVLGCAWVLYALHARRVRTMLAVALSSAAVVHFLL